jgi:methyl acetate hydrolase
MMDTSKIDQVLAEAASSGRVPGVQATVATDDGVVYEGAHGVRELGGSQPMTTDTVCWIASMTKAVTGAAAMQLVEQGKLSLDDPAAKVIPQLGEVQVLDGFGADGQPKLRPPKSDVTLRNLLTHTSGYVYDIWNTDMLKYNEVMGTPPITSCLNAALSTPLSFDPGTKWDYGIGIDWAGKMVEAVSGQRLSDYLAANIIQPLGMKSTGFKLTDSQRSRLSSVHARTPDGLVVMPFELEQNPEFEMGGGGLYSTVGDYLQFTQMIMNNGKWNGNQILKADTVADMSKNHIGDLTTVPLVPAVPSFSNETDFYPGMPVKWGLSFMINTQTSPEGRSAGSLAWAGLANSYYWIDPVKRVTGALATQIFPFFDTEAVDTFRKFETAVYASL